MTFSALMGQMTNSPVSTYDYVPSGTDEAEALRYQEALRVSEAVPLGDQLYDEDFREAGFGSPRENS